MVFRAFADATRLRILNLLGEGELCVCDVMRVLKEPQSKVSRHLSYLRKADLVAGSKHGLWMHYRLSELGRSAHRFFLKGFGESVGEAGELKHDLLELNRTKPKLIACCK